LLSGAVAHLGALVILFAVTLPPGVGIGLGLAVIVSAARALRAVAQLGPDAVVALSHSADGGWALRRRSDSPWQPIELIDGWSHPRLVVLSVRLGDARVRRLPIPWDALDPDGFRRLRVTLAATRSGPPAIDDGWSGGRG